MGLYFLDIYAEHSLQSGQNIMDTIIKIFLLLVYYIIEVDKDLEKVLDPV